MKLFSIFLAALSGKLKLLVLFLLSYFLVNAASTYPRGNRRQGSLTTVICRNKTPLADGFGPKKVLVPDGSFFQGLPVLGQVS